MSLESDMLGREDDKKEDTGRWKELKHLDDLNFSEYKGGDVKTSQELQRDTIKWTIYGLLIFGGITLLFKGCDYLIKEKGYEWSKNPKDNIELMYK